MKNKNIYTFLSFLIFSFNAVAAPLCSVVFTHDFQIDSFADVAHQGAFDVGFEINRHWLLADKPVPAYQSPPANAPARLSLKDIHFMQGNVSNNFSDAKYTVVGNARQIRDGQLNPDTLPALRVWQDTSGKIWTLDHRRLISMILSGKVESVKVQWASPKEVKDQSSKMSNLDEGDSLVLTAKGQQSLLIERPGRGVGKKGVTKIRLKNVPRYGNRILPKQIKQTAAVDHSEVHPHDRAAQIHFSTTSSVSETAIDWAHKIRSGNLKIEALPALRVWVDSSGRTWTLDNDLLAALRLADVAGPVKIRRATPEELLSPEAIVDTQTGGQSYVIPLRNQGDAIVVHQEL